MTDIATKAMRIGIKQISHQAIELPWRAQRRAQFRNHTVKRISEPHADDAAGERCVGPDFVQQLVVHLKKNREPSDLAHSIRQGSKQLLTIGSSRTA